MYKRLDIEPSLDLRIVELKYRSQNVLLFSLVTSLPLYLSIIRRDDRVDDHVGIPQLERRFKESAHLCV